MEGELQTYAIYFCIWLATVLFLRSLLASLSGSGRQRHPPSPTAIPLLGHLHLLAPIPHQALHRLSLRHGPLMRVLLGSVPCVVASDADTAKEFLKTHEIHFASRPQSAAVSFLTYGSADFSFAPYGPYWKFMKKLCMSELLGGRTLDQLLHVRREELRGLLRSLLSRSGQTIDMGGELLKLTNNIISRMTMGCTCTSTTGEAEEVRKLVEEVAELTGKFNLSDYIAIFKNFDIQGFQGRCKKVQQRFDTMMDNIIREKAAARKSRTAEKTERGVIDILDILLDIAEDEKAEMKITRENIKAFILDIFVAGTDTSAITTEWALAELINHPDVLKKAVAEIESVVGKTRLVEESDIADLPYVQAIVKETLRLHPTGPIILRQSTEDCTVGGYDIPAGTRLFVNVWAIGRDARHWEEPLQFKPERFMAEGGDRVDVRGGHFQLLPFGSGRRGCPGTSLALQVIQTTVAALVQCFEWKAEDGEGKVDMREAAGLTLPRLKPLVCAPVARLDPFPSFE